MTSCSSLNFKEKVTGVDGGTALLLALGFTLKIDPEPDREVVKGVVGVFSSAGGLITQPRPVEAPVAITGTALCCTLLYATLLSSSSCLPHLTSLSYHLSLSSSQHPWL